VTARVNDFALKIATPNGSGSASANGMVMQAIFRMGVPVSGKNLFPSNIQGLPTWYEIRVSKHGHLARTPDFDLVLALNPASYKRDVAEVRAGGWLLYDATWPLDESLRRSDITILGIPLAGMCNDAFTGGRERILMKNIAYVGALAALLDLDMGLIRAMLGEKYGSKAALMASNQKAIDLGYAYAREHFRCPLPIRMERMNATSEHILIDGNTAAALGCVYAGATVGAWYPITPSTSLMEAFKGFCKKYREVDGKRRYVILQAEDELAALGMVVGAGWAGARAFTPTSGPGISLMSELVGLAYYAEIPTVIFDVQRAGPSTGMPTRTQQGDLLLTAYASHGDTRHICLYPADPGECFTLAVAAFDLAERFQTPVFVLSDLDVGMNDWMVRRFEWDDAYRPNRGKVLTAEQIAALPAFHRYVDADGDGIAARTLPGVHEKGGYFARGSGHNRLGAYTEESHEYVEVVDRIARKIDGAASALPSPVLRRAHGPTRAGIITVGSCEGAVLEALSVLEKRGQPMDYLRIRGFPFAAAVRDFIDGHPEVYVVEQNRDGQLKMLLQLETGFPAHRLRSVRYYGGMPLSSQHVLDGVRAAREAS